MEALERKLAAHHAAKEAVMASMMSDSEVGEAEARLAELKRRAAAGELTDEERREMEALERKLAAHHAAKEAVEAADVAAAEAAAAEAAAAGGGGRGGGSAKGRGGGNDGVTSDGTDQGDGSSADQTVPGWLKKSKTFGARLAKGGFAGLFDTEDTLVASLAHDWGWASENKIEEYIVKHDAGGKVDPDGALDRVKGVLQELYGTILSLYYYYASATTDLDTYTIGPNEFNMFIVDNDVAINGSPECSKHHLEQLFIGVDSGQKVKEEFNKLHALSRQEFLQVLIRICVHRYMKPRRRGEQPLFTDVSEAMREFFSVHLFPRLDPAALQVSNDFRQKFVYIEETDDALYEHVETLTALYEVYSGKDHDRSDLTAHSKSRAGLGTTGECTRHVPILCPCLHAPESAPHHTHTKRPQHIWAASRPRMLSRCDCIAIV